MNRTDYRNARALIRANGAYALRWMSAPHAAAMRQLLAIADTPDPLAVRAWIKAHFAPSMLKAEMQAGGAL